jgi:2'-5' RNA ligase
VGELFDSFDESWSHFLGRQEPLESFVDRIPAREDATVAVWLVPLEPRLAPAVASVQRRLPSLPWLRPLPAHFLHVTVASFGFLDAAADVRGLVERGEIALRGLEPFGLGYPRLNCFHEAVVAEVESEGIHEAAARMRTASGPFLPHLSLAYTTAPGPPGELRDLLRRIRETDLGAQQVSELLLCLVPASRTTILAPWTVAGTVALEVVS